MALDFALPWPPDAGFEAVFLPMIGVVRPASAFPRPGSATGVIVRRAEALGEAADHVMVRAAFAMGRQDRAAELQVGVSAAQIDVVMLEEGRRRQHDVGHRHGFGHELLVDADEEIGTREAVLDEPRFRGDDQRVGVLDQ